MQHIIYCKSGLVNALVDFIVCHCVIDCFRLALIGVANQPVRRAADSTATPVQNVCVNHRGANVAMAQEFLYCPNVVPIG